MTRLLEELSWVSVGLLPEASESDFKVSVTIASNESERQISFQLPLFVYDLPMTSVGEEHWEEFCRLLKQHGIPLRSSVHTLENNAANAIPIRMALRSNGESFTLESVESADLLTVQFKDIQSGVWGWPLEIAGDSTSALLPDFVSTLRTAIGGDTPIGIALPIVASEEDIRQVVQSRPEYLLLDGGGNALDAVAIRTIAAARRIAREESIHSLPILANVGVSGVDEMLKCLALGANALAGDLLFKQHLPEPQAKEAETSYGMLSSLTAAAPEKESVLKPVSDAVESLDTEFRLQLSQLGCSDISELNARMLQATSEAAASLTGVSLVGRS